MYAIILHHEHACDNPAMEAIIGPYDTLKELNAAMDMIRTHFNEGRDAEDGLFTVQRDGINDLLPYVGINDEYSDHGDIVYEVWAEAVEMRAPETLTAQRLPF